EDIGNDDNIQHLIDRLPISDPLTDQFIQIENELHPQEIPTDQEIIDMVKYPDEPDEPDKPDEPEEQTLIVKSGEAVHRVDNSLSEY
ncbi:7427_t:CDS:2, partial [Paraglomus brasilianum]